MMFLSKYLIQALTIKPDDGFALVHLGFALKGDLKYKESIPFFEKGIANGDEGTNHMKFSFHLVDASYRLVNSLKVCVIVT